MARPKKTVAKMAAEAKVDQDLIVLTQEQFKTLSTLSEYAGTTRRFLSEMEDGIKDLAHAGYIAGQAHCVVDKLESELDDLINELTPPDYDDDITW